MDLPLPALAAMARAWDDHHLALDAAAQRVVAASTGGFTATVVGPADRFTAAWGRHLRSLADRAEAHADGLRATAVDVVGVDAEVAGHARSLDAVLREVR